MRAAPRRGLTERVARRRAVVAALAAFATVVACGRGESGAPGRSGAPARAKGRTGIVACDEYFDAVDDCLEGASAERREMLQRSAEVVRRRITGTPTEAAAKAHAGMCRQALRMLAKNPACQQTAR